MIAALSGTLIELMPTACVLDVGGVGYLVAITPAHSRSLAVGQHVKLVTAMVVREDSMTLFGFGSTEERELFDQLRGVTGVGPKLALAILAQLSPTSIAEAVVNEDDKTFAQVSGIGPKTAKLLVVTLAGRLKSIASSVAQDGKAAAADSAGIKHAVMLALTGLGIQEGIAAGAVAEALELNPGSSRDALLRDVLSALGKAKR